MQGVAGLLKSKFYPFLTSGPGLEGPKLSAETPTNEDEKGDWALRQDSSGSP